MEEPLVKPLEDANLRPDSPEVDDGDGAEYDVSFWNDDYFTDGFHLDDSRWNY